MKRTLFATALFACAATALPAHASITQWTAGNNHWYEPVIAPGTGGISWTDANAAAIAKGGYLATITSAPENSFVYSLISGNLAYWRPANGANTSGPWLGGRQTDELAEPSGHWSWVTGESWSYTNWNPGEPNNFYPGEDYLHYLGVGGPPAAVWNDAEVFGHAATDAIPGSYIIEYNTFPAPEPSSLGILGLSSLALFAKCRLQKR
jgi:hypothetical protein